MSFQLVTIPRSKYITHGPVGNINHYGHFILDLALPLFKHHRKIKVLYLNRPSFPAMLEHFQKIYPNIKVVVDPQVASKQHKVGVQGYCWLNFHTDLLRETRLFQAHVVNITKRGVKSDTAWPKIIMIQRSISKKIQGSNGAKRRYIGNHQQLANALKAKYGIAFKNIILEDLDFPTQVAYFNNAKVVIGQYGSGLVNIFWMRLGKTCICLTRQHMDAKDKTFMKCCSSRRVKYVPIYCTAKGKNWNAPAAQVMNAVAKNL